MDEALCAWEDAVLVGVTSDLGRGGGLAANPARRILATDRMMFIGATSNPHPIAAGRDAQVGASARAAASRPPPACPAPGFARARIGESVSCYGSDA